MITTSKIPELEGIQEHFSLGDFLTVPHTVLGFQIAFHGATHVEQIQGETPLGDSNRADLFLFLVCMQLLF